ncbi:MAG: 2-phospho-L-lactate transferase [Methanomicrobiales archaeon]|nr:2-phospho-L-lactate transferase [Methanomicrobiales archaeon]
MITFLSGGTGTPKLLLGMRELMDESDISVIVNTAEDLWMSGNYLSPDIDTVIYLFAGILDTQRWWGIEGDTYATHEEIRRHGGEEYLAIGDRDRAVHILRGEMLRRGLRLTECTTSISRIFGVRAQVLPMSDTAVNTIISTPEGEMHFQEYWVRFRGEPKVLRVHRRFEAPPITTGEALSTIAESAAVVIGPSNPVTSIMPILECRGIKEAMKGKTVVAVSPFMGDRPFSGPAAPLMRAWGLEPTAMDTYRLYRGIATLFIQDVRDPYRIKGAYAMDTLMSDRKKSIDLAEEILQLVEQGG